MGDGTGRDTYVVTSNGGLANVDKPHMMRRALKNPKDNSITPMKPLAANIYRADGSGRDTYVVSNSGGLVYDFRGVPVDQQFKGMLRNN